MSFNVRGSFRDIGRRNAWRNRAELNVATVERHAPDLIGLQEFQSGNFEAYRTRLPQYAHVRGPPYGNGVPHDFNPIFFDPERLEVLDSGGFWLSETPERRSRNWETRVARSANWALFRLLDTDLSFLHLNTHLDHISGLARREGSKLITRKVNQILEPHADEPPAILTGDFNCRPGTPTQRNFVESGFVDTYLAAGNEDTGAANTFHAFQGPRYRDAHPERGPRRIDWILLKDPHRRFRVASHRILRDGEERAGLYPSDHYPILARLTRSDRP